VEALLELAIQSQADKAVCKALSDFSEGGLVRILKDMKDALDEYPSDLQIDALGPETNLVVPYSVSLLNLKDDYNNNNTDDIIQLLELGLKEAVKVFVCINYSKWNTINFS